MNESPESRPTFTLRQLLVLVAIVGAGLALLMPVIEQSRSTSRRTQCVNNLKQIGLAINNYHDIRQEICPAYLTDDNSPAGRPRDFMAWPILLLPYLERNDLYELFDPAQPVSRDVIGPLQLDSSYAGPPPTPLRYAPNHRSGRVISFSTYFCPERRTSPKLTANSQASVGDYASVSLASTNKPYDRYAWLAYDVYVDLNAPRT